MFPVLLSLIKVKPSFSEVITSVPKLIVPVVFTYIDTSSCPSACSTLIGEGSLMFVLGKPNPLPVSLKVTSFLPSAICCMILSLSLLWLLTRSFFCSSNNAFSSSVIFSGV